MFVGRKSELQTLERLYERSDFRMAVVYGRRRVGKTRLLSEFGRGKRIFFFTAQQKSNALNLRSFSRELYAFFGLPTTAGALLTWEDAFDFLFQQAIAAPEPFVFVFDEFPYAAEAEPSLPSTLQIAIDHKLKQTNCLLILCGSNEGFMESKVLGRKSPLYGRRNAQIRLEPLDYLDASRFVAKTSTEERIAYYSAFGGTPYYLEQIDVDASFAENVSALMFDMAGALYAEPGMLLRQETREPALYSSILDAVAAGATVPKRIAEQAGVLEGTVGRYLKSLESLGLVERRVPIGENPKTSRKGIYRIADPFFAYWYRFVSPASGAIESGLGAAAAARAVEAETLSTYVGMQFERACLQWLVRQAKVGKLPLLPTELGAWWGTDPSMREQADIDIVIADKAAGRALFGECKWCNSFNETKVLETLRYRSTLVRSYNEATFALFTKKPVGAATKKKAQTAGDVLLVDANRLFEG